MWSSVLCSSPQQSIPASVIGSAEALGLGQTIINGEHSRLNQVVSLENDYRF